MGDGRSCWRCYGHTEGGGVGIRYYSKHNQAPPKEREKVLGSF